MCAHKSDFSVKVWSQGRTVSQTTAGDLAADGRSRRPPIGATDCRRPARRAGTLCQPHPVIPCCDRPIVKQSLGNALLALMLAVVEATSRLTSA